MASKVQFKIAFARGDSYDKGFILKSQATGEPVTDEFDEVYFTVKKYSTDQDYLFQKKMTDGGIYTEWDGKFTVYIAPEDTDNLSFGEYDCDMEFVSVDDEFKRTFYGKLELTKEVTYASNE